MKNLKTTLDPRTKLIIVLFISSLAVFKQDIKYLSAILLVALITGKFVNSEFFLAIKKLKGMLKIIVFIILIQSIFTRTGNPLVEVKGFILVTDVGLERGLGFLLRMMIILFSATILTTSTSREIVQGLVQWKIPYEIAFMVSVAIRFIPMLAEEIKDTLIAIQLRGIELESLNFKKKIQVYSYIFTPVVLGTIIKSQQLSMAMETRGFRAYKNRTSYMKLAMKREDYLVIAFGTVLFIFAAYLYH